MNSRKPPQGFDPGTSSQSPGVPTDAEADRLAVVAGKTGRGGTVAIGSQMLTVVLQLVNLAVLSRLLNPGDFGLVAISGSVVTFFALVRDFGLSSAIIQNEKMDQDTLSGIFWVNLGISVIFMLIAWASAPVSAMVFEDRRVVPLIMVTSATFPIAAVASHYSALLRRNLDILAERLTNISGQIIGTGVAVGLVIFTDLGYWALIANAWAAAIAQVAIFWMRSPWRPSGVSEWKGTFSAIRFGLPLTGTSIVFFLNRQFDNLLIGWRWGEIELGFYSRAYALLMLPHTLISGPIGSAVIPGLSRMQSDREKWCELLLQAVRFTGMLSFLVAAVLIVNAREVVLIILGPQWLRCVNIVMIFGLSMVARSVMNQNPWIYTSLGHTGQMLRWQLTTLPAYLAGMVIGLRWGAEGVAAGFSIAHILLCLPSLVAACRNSPVAASRVMRQIAPVFVLFLLVVMASLGIKLWLDLGPTDILSCIAMVAFTASLFLIGLWGILLADPEYRSAKTTISDQFRLIASKLLCKIAGQR